MSPILKFMCLAILIVLISTAYVSSRHYEFVKSKDPNYQGCYIFCQYASPQEQYYYTKSVYRFGRRAVSRLMNMFGPRQNYLGASISNQFSNEHLTFHNDLFNRPHFGNLEHQIPEINVKVDHEELNRISSPFNEARLKTSNPISFEIDRPNPKTAIGYLEDNYEKAHPVYITQRGEQINHWINDFKSWRVTKITDSKWSLGTSKSLNLSIPEYYLSDLIGYYIADSAGLVVPEYGMYALYINDRYEGLRIGIGQPGVDFMKTQKLPIGYYIDPRRYANDVLSNIPVSKAQLTEVYFGSQPLDDGDFTSMKVNFDKEELIAYFIFRNLFPNDHFADIRFYVDPVTMKWRFIPWNLEWPNLSHENLEDRININSTGLYYWTEESEYNELADLIESQFTPEMLHVAHMKLFSATKDNGVLHKERLYDYFHQIDQIAREEMRIFPHGYYSKDSSRHWHSDRTQMEYRTKLINLIETNYARMEMEKTRFSVACHAYKRGVSCLNNLGLGQKLIGATIKGKRGSQYSIFLDGNGDGVQQKNESTLSSTNKLMAPISDTILLFKGLEGTTRTGLNLGVTTDSNANHHIETLIFQNPVTSDINTVRIRINGRSLDLKRPDSKKPDYAYHLPEFIENSNRSKSDSSKIYEIKPGYYKIYKTTAIPDGATLHIHEGVTLSIAPFNSLYVSGPLIISGTRENPVKIQGSPNIQSGNIVVNYTNDETLTQIHYADFDHVGESNLNGVSYTGSLNIYGANAQIVGSNFSNILAEDAINVKWGNVEIKASTFTNTLSDGLDFDYSFGSIEDSRFNNIGNDAIDLGDSLVNITKVRMDTMGDKGISIGGRSFPKISSTDISRADIGVQIKDDSKVEIKSANIINSRIGIHFFKKRINTVSMQASINDVEFVSNDANIEIDSNIPFDPIMALRK